MKKYRILLSCVVLLMVLTLMIFTKPGVDRYQEWVQDKVSGRMAEKQPRLAMALSLFGDQLIKENTTESDLLIAKVFETEWMGRKLKVIGVFGFFIPISDVKAGPD